jgi:hypothetical protein
MHIPLSLTHHPIVPSPSTSTSLLPNTKPPRHIIRTPPHPRPRHTLTKQTLHILILRHLPPLVALVLLLHDFLCEAGCRAVFDAVAVVLGCGLPVGGLGVGGLGFGVGGLSILLALLTPRRLLKPMRQPLLPQCLNPQIQARDIRR